MVADGIRRPSCPPCGRRPWRHGSSPPIRWTSWMPTKRLLSVGGRPHPVWLIGRTLPGGRFILNVLADDRTGSRGEALYYRAATRSPSRQRSPGWSSGPPGSTGGPPGYRLDRDEQPGVALDAWLRRVLLAWSLQAPELLGTLKPGTRVDWSLTPTERAAPAGAIRRLGRPGRSHRRRRAHLAGGRLPARHGVPAQLAGGLAPAPHRGSARRAARRWSPPIPARCTCSPCGRQRRTAGAWAAIAAGVIEPAAALPEAIWRSAPYPDELFRVQARQLERSPRRLGCVERTFRYRCQRAAPAGPLRGPTTPQDR